MALNQKPFGDIITFSRASAATRINSLGVRESVASNVPRIDYDPITLAVKGLLIEEQRTNLFTFSEFPNGLADASSLGGLVAATSLSGFSGALSVGYNGSQLQPAYKSSANLIASTQYVISAFVKMDDGLAPSVANSTPTASVNDFAFVIGATPIPPPYNVQNVGGGVYRVSGSMISGSTNLNTNGLIKYSQNSARTFVFSGLQIEQGAFATSYIPTTAAQVTRASDSARINTLSPWYNAAEGTIFAEITPLYTSSGNHAVWIGSDFDNYIGLQYSAAAIQKYNYFRRAGTFYMPVGARGDAISGETLKTATSYKAGQKIIESYGGVNRDGSDVLPAAPVATALALCVSAGGTGVNGARYIRKLRYYPKAMTNAEIAALTA